MGVVRGVSRGFATRRESPHENITDGGQYGYYMIMRGGPDILLMIGDVPLPKEAWLQLQKFQGRMDDFQVLDNTVSPPQRQAGLPAAAWALG